MRTISVYHVEDQKDKRARLQLVLDFLNVLGTSENIEFEDAIGPRWSDLLATPQSLADTIWEAATKENSIFLVDIRLYLTGNLDPNCRPFDSAAKLLEKKLNGEGLEELVVKANSLLKVLGAGRRTEDAWLASLLVVIFRHFGTRFIYASTAKLNVLPALNEEFQAPSIPWPEGFEQDVDQNLIELAAKTIYEVAVRQSDLDIEMLVDLGHPSSQREKLAAASQLRKFLRLNEAQFGAEFEMPGGAPHENAMKALKSISGARAGLDLKAAWLLALGVYRSQFPWNDWKSKWDPNVFRSYPAATHYSIAHANTALEQSDDRPTRLGTLRSFTNLCACLFKHDTTGIDILLRVNFRPDRLEFVLDIPFEGLRPTLVKVFRHARGDAAGIGERSHDTSSAILHFAISSLFSAEIRGKWVIAPPHALISVGEAEGRTYVRFG